MVQITECDSVQKTNIKPIKQKKCKQCKSLFTPMKPLQCVCGFECAKAWGNKQTTKALNQDTRRQKIALKTRQEWLKETQQVVNKYVRLRDESLGCVSCDKPATWKGQWHASHYRTTKAASSIRFNLWNIHKSCSVCNNWLSGNLGEYEPRIRLKIGNEKVDWLRSQNETANYSIEYLKRLKGIFKKKCAKLEKRKTNGTT